MKQVWDALKVEVAKKTEVTVFERFKENFDKLTHSDIFGLDFPLIDEQLADMKNEITELCKMLLKQKFTWGDYKKSPKGAVFASQQLKKFNRFVQFATYLGGLLHLFPPVLHQMTCYY